jgi:hypothetical protein
MVRPNVYFAATPEDFSRVAPGWILASPNTEPPVEKIGRNPFTDAEVRVLDYRNSSQPEAPSTSAFPDISGFKQAQSRLLDPSALGDLVHAIDGSDPDAVYGQILGQELISSGEHEISIMQVPRAISAVVAEQDEGLLDDIAKRWTKRDQKVLRKGLLAKVLGRYSGKVIPAEEEPIDLKRKVLGEFHALARFASENDLAVFLMQST